MQSFACLVAASAVLRLPLANPLPDTTGAIHAPGLPLACARYELSRDSASPQRPKAIQYSDAYYTRLAIHRYASYATVPLFVAEYFLGQSLYNRTAPPDTARPPSGLRNAHGLVADGIGALFLINTVTGVWNLSESTKNPNGRARRDLHAALILLSDAGFVATAALVPSGRDLAGLGDPNRRTLHRTVALVSMGTALAGYLTMVLWKH